MVTYFCEQERLSVTAVIKRKTRRYRQDVSFQIEERSNQYAIFSPFFNVNFLLYCLVLGIILQGSVEGKKKIRDTMEEDQAESG